MKHIAFFTTLFSLFFLSTTYGEENASYEEENAMMEIEKELLSLEDELLQIEEPTDLSLTPSSSQTEEPSTLPLLTEDTKAVTLAEETTLDILEPESSSPIFLEEEPTLSPLFTESSKPIEPSQQLSKGTIQVDLKQVFYGSPYIYTTLFLLSLFAIAISLYTFLRLNRKSFNPSFVSGELRHKLLEDTSSNALAFCQKSQNLLCKMIASGLSCQSQGTHAMLEVMKAEGKRVTVSSWQRLNLLQDIAVIAPMIGLLGTIIGLFYAFYDLNRSFDSIANLLDGLGISVGTTVAGIVVAILAMTLHSAAKFRLVRTLVKVESEATSLAYLIDENKP